MLSISLRYSAKFCYLKKVLKLQLISKVLAWSGLCSGCFCNIRSISASSKIVQTISWQIDYCPRITKFRANNHFDHASFTECLLCTNDYLFTKNVFAHRTWFPPSPVQIRSFLNRNVCHSLAAIFNFCFYCRRCEQNVNFTL